MNAAEKELFRRTAYALRQVLGRCTNLTLSKRPRLKEEKDYDGCSVAVATFPNDEDTSIEIFYDRYLDSTKGRSFWVGFFSNEHQIQGLIQSASKTFSVQVVEDPQSISQFDKAIVEYLHRKKPEEFDYDCFGIYFGPSKNMDLSKAVRFLCDAMRAIPGIEIRLNETEIDIVSIENDPSLTERDQLIKARRGQGRYRQQLEEIWGNACAVLGLTTKEVLRASHAKPWAICDNDERLSGHNGLLLSAHLDALFDKYLITFDGCGQIKISSRVPEHERQALRLDDLRLRTRPGVELAGSELESFLAYHRLEFERKQAAHDTDSEASFDQS